MASKSWHLAPALVALLGQINTLSPNRDKRSDGTIGDAAHAARKSDHNPDPDGTVRGLDITNDPKHGIVSDAIAKHLVAKPDARLDYVISNGMIASRAAGWKWRKYTGKNPHDKHVHISVLKGATANQIQDWSLPGVKAKDAAKPISPEIPVLAIGVKGRWVEVLQHALNEQFGADLREDGVFGQRTKDVVIAFQRKNKLEPDGVVGVYTWRALGQED